MTEIWRGPLLESVHSGHAVICDASGNIVESWGDPDTIVLPRSSAKMIQALPLLNSGAVDAAGLTPRHLSLACASHHAAAIHTDLVTDWLKALNLDDDAFRCGGWEPKDRTARDALIRSGQSPCQMHNECSGKHSGFLTLGQHLKAGPEYINSDHPVQKEVLDVFETVTGQQSPGHGIDGCSAPNFATTMHGMARAMADFANASDGTAEARLHQAMRLHPEMVAGEGGASTELISASGGRIAIKTGAEGFCVAILPEQKLGVAVKISDGAGRAASASMAAILIRLGALDPEHPDTARHVDAPIVNKPDMVTGVMKSAAALR